MYTCELCGEPTDQKIFRTIEGVKMLVCRNCMSMGEKPQYEREDYPVQKKTPKFYLDEPNYPPRSKTLPNHSRKSKPAHHNPINVPIDRLTLVEDYRDILKKIRSDNEMDQGEFANSVIVMWKQEN
jgi:ribosome-binding protein aMBF1 (putative translation factor)